MQILKFAPVDQENAYKFFITVYREFGWDEKLIYGMDNIGKTFGGEKEIFLIAKENGKIVGCVGLKYLDDKTALMKRFYLAPETRGTGLAAEMLQKIIKFAKENNYKEIALDTFLTNFRAQRFYEKNGFITYSPAPNKNWPESKLSEIYQFRKLQLEK